MVSLPASLAGVVSVFQRLLAGIGGQDKVTVARGRLEGRRSVGSTEEEDGGG